MNASQQWLWPQSQTGGLLSNEDCELLLDHDIFNNNDLLKTFPTAASKIITNQLPMHDDNSSTLYAPSSPSEFKPSPDELSYDSLQHLSLANALKPENNFANWLEEKIDLPVFQSYALGPDRVEVSPHAVPVPDVSYSAPQATEELLREFETVYGAVELTHLTPPNSPPRPATQLLLSYAQQAQCAPPAVPMPVSESIHISIPDDWTAPGLTDFDSQLHNVMDVASCGVSELPSPHFSGSSTSVSPISSPLSSPRSSDDDWSITSRSKPYSRPVEERRSRKKEQNKNAATRYRQKKKAEIEVLLSEEQTHRQRHTELGNKCSDLQREIRYLKGLMRDLFKAKGLIK